MKSGLAPGRGKWISARAGQPPVKKRSRMRRDDLATERVTIYLPTKMVMALRRLCLDQRRSLSDALTEAARLFLRSKRKSKKR